jgi:UDP-glucose 4-epimerase
VNILLTGGTGYLGGRIAYDLVQRGVSVRLAVRDVTKVPSALKKCDIVVIDFDDSVSFNAVCNDIDIVIHLAAMNASECQAQPEKALLVNGRGTARLLVAANKSGVKQFIYFSTAHIYGAPLVGFVDENKVPEPNHPYAITHLLAEYYVRESSKKHNMEHVVLRLSNAVGAPLSEEANCWMLVANDFVKQAVQKRTIVTNSPGNIQRDFVAITDVCRLISFLLERKGEAFQLFNVGGGSMSLSELAKTVAIAVEKVAGFMPIIECFQGELGQDTALDFSFNKLQEAGFLLENRMQNEIVELAEQCRQWFAHA